MREQAVLVARVASEDRAREHWVDVSRIMRDVPFDAIVEMAERNWGHAEPLTSLAFMVEDFPAETPRQHIDQSCVQEALAYCREQNQTLQVWFDDGGDVLGFLQATRPDDAIALEGILNYGTDAWYAAVALEGSEYEPEKAAALLEKNYRGRYGSLEEAAREWIEGALPLASDFLVGFIDYKGLAEQYFYGVYVGGALEVFAR